MLFKNREKIFKNLFYLLIIGVVLISFLPLIKISRYNCPSADDFSYAVTTYEVWNNTHSFSAVIKEAVNTSVRYWNTWQGLYASAFLLALQPAVFGSNYYAYTGIIMLFLIATNTIVFSIYLLKRLFERSLLEATTVGFVLSFLMIHYMPSCVEGLFWFNGAVNYGFFFSILLIYMCLLIELQRANTRLKYTIIYFLCIFEIFFLEGGNHVTALMGIVFTFSIIAVCFKREKSKTVGNILLGLIGIIFLYFNLKSPGTAIRQAAIDMNVERMGILETIWMSVVEAIGNVGDWLGFKEIALAIILLPILLPLVHYIKERLHFRFRFPLIITIASVAWLSIMYCPPFYAMSAAGNGRLIDIVYYSFIILLYINITYYIGWICGKIKNKESLKVDVLDWKYMFTAILLAFTILLADGKESWGYEALLELYLGEAQQYSKEYTEREKLLMNSPGEDIVVVSFSIEPEVLYFDDIVDDANDWKNVAVADYYNLNSIKKEAE